jgi:hypothetical protein
MWPWWNSIALRASITVGALFDLIRSANSRAFMTAFPLPCAVSS